MNVKWTSFRNLHSFYKRNYSHYTDEGNGIIGAYTDFLRCPNRMSLIWKLINYQMTRISSFISDFQGITCY